MEYRNERHRDMCKMMLGGKTLKQIADVYGVTPQRIQQITKKYGVRRPHKYEVIAEKALEMHRAGDSIFKIMVAFDTCQHTARRAIKHASV